MAEAAEVQSLYKREPDGSLVPLSVLCDQWARQYDQADYGMDLGGAREMQRIKDLVYKEHRLRGHDVGPLNFSVSGESLRRKAAEYREQGL